MIPVWVSEVQKRKHGYEKVQTKLENLEIWSAHCYEYDCKVKASTATSTSESIFNVTNSYKEGVNSIIIMMAQVSKSLMAK